MFDFMDMGYDESSAPIASGPYIPDAGECMRCGLCVSSCPTFRLFQVDEETPRRRLRTLSKILVENQPVSSEEQSHLDNCLQCRACETVCPSRVNYGELFDQARMQLQVKPGWLGKLAFSLIERKRLRSLLIPLFAVYLKLGLQKPLRKTGLLTKLHLAEAEGLMGKPAVEALAERYPTSATKRGQVALFTGCIAEHFDRETLLAAIRLLNEIGYEVLVPSQQGCCGAIHQHNGQAASVLIDNNIKVFNALNVEAVLHTSTACGAMLSEYKNVDDGAVQLFQQRLCDINDFLLQHWPDDLQLKSDQVNIAVHEPCSQRNILKNSAAVYGLLQKVQGLNVVTLADNSICCGAGGSYMLSHSQNAGQLRALKQQIITESSADVVVSSNFGCALFLTNDEGKVVHPLVLIAGHLDM